MVTMNDIATRAGVSQATVSYVLNGRNDGIRIREETRQRILEMATELGYRRNDLARAMVTGKTFVLGFLTRNPSAEGSSRILVGAHEEANKHGYFVKMLPIAGDEDYKSSIQRCMEQRLAGILVQNLGPDALDYLKTETSRFKMPVVMMDDMPVQNWGSCVTSDDEHGLQTGIKHLVQLGHRRIGFVSAQASTLLAQERERKFRVLMKKANLTVSDNAVIFTDWQDATVIEDGVRKLLSDPSTRPTALMCAGDMIAMVTQRTARAMGINVPRDLSVVGFANFLMSNFADPPLTTIAQPFEEIGRLSVRALLGTGKKNDAPAMMTNPVIVPSDLVVRASTAPPRDEIFISSR